MAAPVRTKIDLSDLDSRPVLRLVPPLPEEEPATRPHGRPGRHRRPEVTTRRVADCAPRRRRRPRVPASFVIGAVVFLGVVGIGMLAGEIVGDQVPTQTAVVWVQPGETLWDVANRAAPGYDTEAVVAKIRELNNVPADGVLAGQALQVPSAP
ncbi:hypothetical protein GCM10029964_024790 [Kibdelosporangium lantanae]